MAIAFNIAADLEATEAAIVDWKRQAKAYVDEGIAVPAHIEKRLVLLKKDARLLRQQLNGENT